MPRVESRTNVYIGIDPGASGGLAIRRAGICQAVPMPPTEADVWHWVKEAGSFLRVEKGVVVGGCETFAAIEQVWGHIGEGQPGSAMFKFGQSYGGLRMALIAAGIPFEQVVPRTWQKDMGIPPRKKEESKTQWKNRLKAMAQQLFPDERVMLATADALLIAEWCRRKREGRT